MDKVDKIWFLCHISKTRKWSLFPSAVVGQYILWAKCTQLWPHNVFVNPMIVFDRKKNDSVQLWFRWNPTYPCYFISLRNQLRAIEDLATSMMGDNYGVQRMFIDPILKVSIRNDSDIGYNIETRCIFISCVQ